MVKGIVFGHFIFSAKAKTNCRILDLSIWVVGKCRGLLILQRTPRQYKAEAYYRQITYFQIEIYGPEPEQTTTMRTSMEIYFVDYIHTHITSKPISIYGSLVFVDSSFCQKRAKNSVFSDPHPNFEP